PFLLSRAWVLVLALALQWSLDSGAVRKYDYVGVAPLSTLSATFDGNWYADVAAHGYSASADTSQEQNYAFFPLYPFLMRLAGDASGLSALRGGYNLAGVLLSHLFFLAALALLYRLTLAAWSDTG